MSNRIFVLATLAAALALSAPSTTIAQDSKPADAPKQAEPKQAEPKKEEPKKEEPKKDPKVADYEKAVKDLTKVEGPFPMYQRKKELLLELPEDKIGKIFFVQATLNTGISALGAQAGDPLGMFGIDAFRFDKLEDRVVLARPNFRYRWDENDSLATASKRSFPEAYLADYRIEQTNPEKKLLLINVSTLFNGDVFRLGEMLTMGAGGMFTLDREKSGPEKIKGFGENTVVRMNLHYTSQRGAANPLAELLQQMLGGSNHLEDSRSAPLKVTYNLWFRQPSDYMPRLADPRVGYFTEDFYSVGRFLEQDRTERYIMRFDLKKKDPTAKLSDPVKPIVWTIDTSVPKEYREAVREGVLRWNKAYERLGYKNAIQVREADETDADFDHADGRHNVIRWTMSPNAGYAVALFRTDPFTGQILNAAVTFDANMLSFAQQEQQRFVVPATAHATAMNALTRHDACDPVDEILGKCDHEKDELRSKLQKMGWQMLDCSYGYGKRESASVAYHALLAGGVKISKEDYARQFIADTISHEVGHCLGLRHNFIASTNLTTDQLADEALVREQGISASVMDYVPVNLSAVLKGAGSFYTPNIGAYDKFAIEYGYSDKAGATPQGERAALARIASRGNQPGLRYMTDEDADSVDPMVVRFDNSKDPLKYIEQQMQVYKRIRDYAITKLPKPGESYATRTNLLLGSTVRQLAGAGDAAAFVGGVLGNRNFRGDYAEQPTLQPVPSDRQRQAMRIVGKYALTPSAVPLPPANVLNNLSLDYNTGDGSANISPIRSLIGSVQKGLVGTLMSASRLERIAENELKMGAAKNKYTVSEHVGSVVGWVFQEVGTSTSFDPMRRDLHRFTVSALITQASAPAGALNEDARTVAADTLRRLVARFSTAAKAPKIDGMSKAHLSEMRQQIGRWEDRRMTSAN